VQAPSLRRLAATTATAGLAVVLVAGVLWAASPLLLPPLIGALLDDTGLVLERLETGRPGPGGIDVARLAVRGPPGRVTVDDLSLRWRLTGPAPTLTAGHLTAVRARRVEVRLAPTDAPATGPGTTTDLAALLPGTLLDGLPVDAVSVAALHVQVPAGPAPLEAQLRGELRGRHLDVDGRLEGGPLAAPLRLRARVGAGPEPGAADRLTVDVDDGEGGDVIAVRAAVSATAGGGVRARGTAHVDAAAAGDLVGTTLPDVRGRLVGTVEGGGGRAAVTLDAGTDLAAVLRVAGTTLGLGFTPQAPVTVTLTPEGLAGTGTATVDWTLDGAASGGGTLDLSEPGGALATPSVTVALAGDLAAAAGRTALSATARLERTARGTRVAPGAELVLRDPAATGAPIGLDRLALTLPDGAELPDAAPPEPVRLAISPGRLDLAGRSVDLAGPPLAIDLHPGGERIAATMTLGRPSLGLDVRLVHERAAARTRLEVRRLDVDLGRSGLAARLAGDAWPARRGRLGWRGTVDGLDASPALGEIRVRGPLTLRDVGLAAGGVDLDGVVADAVVELGRGRLALDDLAVRAGTAEYRAAPRAEPLRVGRLTLDGSPALVWDDPAALPAAAVLVADALEVGIGRATRAGYAVDDAALTVAVEGPPTDPAALFLDGRLTAATLDVGLPITDLDCPATLDGGVLRLGKEGAPTPDECGAALLGGRVATPGARLTLPAGDGYVPVAIRGLDLGAVLALMQDAALDGTGTLDGAVPVRLDEGRVRIADGFVGARPPGGVLRYRAAPALRARLSQPGLDLALDALTDFHYGQLGAEVDYAPDGTLRLGVHLGGANPDVQDGRTIRFNLNVTQNLPTLLQSLRLSQNIGDDLRRRLEERLAPRSRP
jgi:hypothetical protein